MATRGLGTLTLDLIAKTAGFIKPMEKSERVGTKSARNIAREQGKMRESMKASLTTAAKWGAGIATAAAGAAVAFTKTSFAAADTIGKVASTAGVSTDTLQEMRHAASLSGVSFNDLDKGMQGLNKRVGELRAGSGSLYTYLNKTNKALLSQVQSARSTDEALNLIYGSMKGLTAESDRAALAAAAFGRSGQRLYIMTDNVKELRQEARDLGLVIDEALIRNAEKANDKLDTLSRVMQTQLTGAVLELAPAIQNAASALIELSSGWGWVIGGEKRYRDEQKELNAVTKEMQNLLALQKEQEDIQTRLLMLKARGLWYDPNELEQVGNNIETIVESIRDLNGQKEASSSADARASISQQQSVAMYRKAFSSLSKITRATYEVMKAEYQRDRDEFIELTGDKVTAHALYTEKITAMNKKLIGADIDEKTKKVIDGLKSEYQALGRTAEERKLYSSLKTAGIELSSADGDTIQLLVNDIYDETAAIKAAAQSKSDYLKMMAEGTEVYNSTMTAVEKYGAALSRIDVLYANGVIGAETYKKALDKMAATGFIDAPGTDNGNELSKRTNELEKWYAKQIALLNEYRQERIDLSEKWNTQEEKIERQYVARIAKIENDHLQVQLAGSAALFGAMSDLTGQFADEQSQRYRAMFAVSKSFALAEAAVKLWQAVAIAGASTTWPENLGAMAGVAAAMSGLVGNIMAIGMAHDGINSVPSTGTWLLKKGERVTTEKTSDKLDRVLTDIQNQRSGEMQINIYEAPGTSAQVTRKGDGRIDVEITSIENDLVDRMNRGTGLSSYLDQRYGRQY